MRYSASTPETRRAMLERLSAEGIESLLGSIPSDVRMAEDLDVAGPWPEGRLLARLDGMKTRRPRVSLAGAGLYHHLIPTPVDSLCARSEWVTSYTPYQAEISQGTLMMYWEFQTYMAMLTGQEVANGGMYDGSTALVEAVLMAMRCRPKARDVLYVSEALHPQYAEVLNTYMGFAGVEVVTMPVDRTTGRTTVEVAAEGQASAIGVVIQSPNYFGVVEDFAGVDTEDGCPIWTCTEALSLALLEPPPAAIAVGECQSFGIPIQLGGPTAGFLATKKAWVRKLPGRLVGRTVDADGQSAYCVTLATREQFIRREKATSNICTSSGLMCLRATTYLSLLGRRGLERLAEKNARTARHFAAAFREMGLSIPFTGPTFNEMVVDCSAKPGLFEALAERDIVFGVPLEGDFEDLKHHYVVAVTEQQFENAADIIQEIGDLARTH